MSDASPESGLDNRLHPLSWIFQIGSTLRSLLIPALLFLFASRGFGYELWALVLIVPAAVVALVKMAVFRYGFTPEDLVIRDGLLTRNERHIPYGRIQNIDLVRNPLHRWLRVAEVRLETASGSKAEAVIRVLSMDAVAEMRARVFADKHPATEDAGREAVQGIPLVHMTTPDVVRYGLIDNRGTVVVGALLGLAWQFGLFEEGGSNALSWSSRDEIRDNLRGDNGAPGFMIGLDDLPAWLTFHPEETGWLATILTFGLLLVAAWVVLRLFSVGLALFRLYRFRLTRDGEDLRTEMGLFTRFTATIPRPRIQLLSIESGWLARRFGRVQVRVETAGTAFSRDSDGDASDRQARWLAPLLPKANLDPLLDEVLPELDRDALQWNPLPARAKRRVRNRTLPWILIPCLLLGALVDPWLFLLLLPGIAWAELNARLWLRHAGWALAGPTVAFRSGWWKRKLSVVRFTKIQTVRLAHNLFDRRYGMASVVVDTAGAGSISHRVNIPFLPRDVAQRLRDRLYAEASETAFRW